MDGFTDPIRVDARDLRPGDRLITTAAGINYLAGVTLGQGKVLGATLESLPSSHSGAPVASWTDDQGAVHVLNGEITDAGYPSFPVWASLKLDQPPVVNNTTCPPTPRRRRWWRK